MSSTWPTAASRCSLKRASNWSRESKGGWGRRVRRTLETVAILGLLLAALMGISLGLLGGGGSILAVPILKYVVGFSAKEAIASSLAVVGLTSLFAAIGHWRSGNVNLRVALVFGSVAMAGTYLGARPAGFFSGAAQLALF